MLSTSPKTSAKFGSSEFRYDRWSQPQPFFNREYFKSSLTKKFTFYRLIDKLLYDVSPHKFFRNVTNKQMAKQMPLPTSQPIQQPRLLQLTPYQVQTLQETYEKHPEQYSAVVQVRSVVNLSFFLLVSHLG
jgi:hypothetical protein